MSDSKRRFTNYNHNTGGKNRESIKSIELIINDDSSTYTQAHATKRSRNTISNRKARLVSQDTRGLRCIEEGRQNNNRVLKSEMSSSGAHLGIGTEETELREYFRDELLMAQGLTGLHDAHRSGFDRMRTVLLDAFRVVCVLERGHGDADLAHGASDREKENREVRIAYSANQQYMNTEATKRPYGYVKK